MVSIRAAIMDFLRGAKRDGKPIPEAEKEALAKDAAKHCRRCVVCGGISTTFGVYIPNKPWEIGPSYTPGRQRAIFYGLCSSCFDLPDREARVEQGLTDNDRLMKSLAYRRRPYEETQ